MVAIANSSNITPDSEYWTPNSSYPYMVNVGDKGRYIVSSVTFDEESGLFGAKKVLPVGEEIVPKDAETQMGFLWVPRHDELFELIERVLQIEPMIPPTQAALESQSDKGKVGVMMNVLLSAIVGFAKASPNETYKIMNTIIDESPETVDVEKLETLPRVEGVPDSMIYQENQLQQEYIGQNYDELFETSTYAVPPRKGLWQQMKDAESIDEKLELLSTTKQNTDLHGLAYRLLAKIAKTKEFREIVFRTIPLQSKL